MNQQSLNRQKSAPKRPQIHPGSRVGRRAGLGRASREKSRPLRWVAGILVLLMSAWVGGCATFQPVEPQEAAAGAQVRVHLTTEGRIFLEEQGGRPQSSVEGLIAEIRDERILLRIPWARRQDGLRGEALQQQLWFEPRYIQGIELRQPDRRRAGLAMAGAGVAVAIAVGVVFGRLVDRVGCPGITDGPLQGC